MISNQGRLDSDKGQAILEAAIALPLVVIIIFTILNIAYMAKSQLLLDYASFAVSRAASVRPEDESEAGVGQARGFIAAALKDLGALLPQNKLFQPLNIDVQREDGKVKTEMSLIQRRKHNLIEGGILGILRSLLDGLFHEVRATTVVPVEERRGGGWFWL